MKICSSSYCHEGGKPQKLENFYKNTSGLMGFQSRCKSCMSIQRKKNYRDEKLCKIPDKLPTALISTIKKSIKNEEEKILSSATVILEMRLKKNSLDCHSYVNCYIAECMSAVDKMKSLIVN